MDEIKPLTMEELDRLDNHIASTDWVFPVVYRETLSRLSAQSRLALRIGEAAAKVRWVEGLYDGSHGWHCGFATVWDNGTWHTWDADGCGGQNDVAPTVAQAKEDATGAAIAQGFVKLSQLMPTELA